MPLDRSAWEIVLLMLALRFDSDDEFCVAAPVITVLGINFNWYRAPSPMRSRYKLPSALASELERSMVCFAIIVAVADRFSSLPAVSKATVIGLPGSGTKYCTIPQA